MRHLLAVLLLSTALPVAAQAPAPLELIPAFIAYKSAPPANISEKLSAAGIVQGIVLPTINAVAVTAPLAALQQAAKDPNVHAIVRQRRLQLHLYGSVTQINAMGVDQPETFENEDGDVLERPGVTGAGVTVAVVDSGIEAVHPGLLGRVLAGRSFEFTLLQRESGVIPAAVWDVYSQAAGPTALIDEVGHGTHCAGIVGGDGTGASGLELRGVAPGVNFVSIKIASAFNGVVADVGFEANAVAALDHLLRNREALGNPRVVSNSWGILEEEEQAPIFGPTNYDPLAEIVRKVVDAGMVMVFSAGNDGGGPGVDTVRPIPGGMDEVISVASSCKADNGSCPGGQVNSFSSRGASVDVAAPGDQILSAMAASILAPLGQATEGDYYGESQTDAVQNRANYMRLSGTSMAAPHVAGVVALLLQANPTLTPAQVREILVKTADDMVVDGDPELVKGFDHASGHGQVNVRRALEQAVLLAQPPQPSKSLAKRSGARFGGALGLPLLLVLMAGVWLRRTRRAQAAQA